MSPLASGVRSARRPPALMAPMSTGLPSFVITVARRESAVRSPSEDSTPRLDPGSGGSPAEEKTPRENADV